eukprot:SAG11_NODE_8412_length_1018_cov_1.389554_2_plen_124_part_00
MLSLICLLHTHSTLTAAALVERSLNQQAEEQAVADDWDDFGRFAPERLGGQLVEEEPEEVPVVRTSSRNAPTQNRLRHGVPGVLVVGPANRVGHGGIKKGKRATRTSKQVLKQFVKAKSQGLI